MSEEENEYIDEEDFENVKDWDSYIKENLEKGQSMYDIFKGKALSRVSGDTTNKEALSMGHFGGKSNGAMNGLILTQEILNKNSSLRPELVPIKIKTKQGMMDPRSQEEAELEGQKENLPIIKIGDKWYFDYPGKVVNSSKISDFVYDIARASGSFQGETKQMVTGALSNIKPVPIFPAMQTKTPTPDYSLLTGKDPDAD